MRVRARKSFSYLLLGVSVLLFLTAVHRQGEDGILHGVGYGGFDKLHRRDRCQGMSQVARQVAGANTSAAPAPSLLHSGPDKYNDRILEQMGHVPEHYGETAPLRYIFVPGGIWDTPLGREKFVEQRCPVDRCALTTHGSPRADAVLIQNTLEGASLRKHPGQIWILWILESPVNSVDLSWLRGKVNWTASYRPDSTIVTPYEKFVPYANNSRLPHSPSRDYAKNKRKLVAWFVSNCNAANRRLQYAHELQRHIAVDVYGACGNKQCWRGSTGGRCDMMLKNDYKFYLSFENSNCEYYITEKLFWNALANDVVPVVMGGRKSDYEKAAPPHSFIHVEDFESAHELAKYLLKLDRDDRLYNEYFLWKNTGRFINTKFWCRICAMLHDIKKPVTWFDDVEAWWRHNGSCTRDRWDQETDVITDWKTSVINK